MIDDETLIDVLDELDRLRADNFVLQQAVANLENELDEAWRCRDGDDV